MRVLLHDDDMLEVTILFVFVRVRVPGYVLGRLMELFYPTSMSFVLQR